MRLRNPRANGQAQACTAPIVPGANFIDPKETLKNARMKIGRNTAAGIADSYTVARFTTLARDRHLSSRRCVLDRVIQDIQEHAAQQPFVAAYEHLFARITGKLHG